MAPLFPVWRWDYGVDDQRHADVANASALGLATSGSAQVGTTDGGITGSFVTS